MTKQFKNDKNYILKKVQSESKNKLINKLIKKSIIEYEKKLVNYTKDSLYNLDFFSY